MGEFSTFPPKIDSEDWNALLDHGLVKPASYIVRKSGSYYEAINGSTSKIDYGGSSNAGDVDGTDASAVLQAALNNLTSGRTYKERVVCQGSFSLNTKVTYDSYTILDWRMAKFTLANGVNDNMFENGSNNVHDVEFIGGELNGNKSNQTASSSGLVLDGVYNFALKGLIFIHDFYTHGIHFAPTTGRTTYKGFAESLIVNDNGGSGVCFGTVGSANSIQINLLYAEGNYENNVSLETGANVNIGLLITRDTVSDNGVFIGSTMDNVTVGQLISRGNSANGVSIRGTKITVSNLLSFDNGSAGTYHGIRILGAASDIVIGNCICFDVGNNFQNYGISIEDTADYITILGGDLRNNVNGAVKITSSGNNINIFKCEGYVTENSGTTTFSGDGTTTTFTIAHGCDATPTYVEIGAKSADAVGDKYWSVDSTNITVTFITAPPNGTDNVILSWKAEV